MPRRKKEDRPGPVRGWLVEYGLLLEHLYLIALVAGLVWWSLFLWNKIDLPIHGTFTVLTSQIFLGLITGLPVAFLLWESRRLAGLVMWVISRFR